MADNSRKVKSSTEAARLGVSADRWFHYDAAGVYRPFGAGKAGSILRVILNTNGGSVTVRNGSEVIGVIAADAPEGPFPYGVYCNNEVTIELGGTADVTVVCAR